MSKRVELRSLYIRGWYELDAEKLLSSTTKNFIFDDPFEAQPIHRDELVNYIYRWGERTRAAGSSNQWILSDEIRQDKHGVLTDWEWWELTGTDLQGSALIKTTDEGVYLERITYFDRRQTGA